MFIIIAALWIPQIGKIMGIFCKRVNGQGAFMKLISGFIFAVFLLFFKSAIFGNMHLNGIRTTEYGVCTVGIIGFAVANLIIKSFI